MTSTGDGDVLCRFAAVDAAPELISAVMAAIKCQHRGRWHSYTGRAPRVPRLCSCTGSSSCLGGGFLVSSVARRECRTSGT